MKEENYFEHILTFTILYQYKYNTEIKDIICPC